MVFFTTYRRQLALAAGLLAAHPAAAQTPAWQSVGGAAFAASPVGAVLDAAGNSYEVASFSGTLAIGSTTLTSLGASDTYLAKYTPTGALAWVRQLGSAGNDLLQGVALDAAGNPYVMGSTDGTIALGNNLTVGSGSGRQVFAVRYSSQGTPVWAQQSTSSNASSGGIGLDASGNVYLAGNYNGTLALGGSTLPAPGVSPTFLARLSGSTGAVESLTAACYFAPSSTGSYSFQAPRLAVAPTGAVYLVTILYQAVVFSPTVTLNTAGNSDVLVARYNAQGGFEWVRQLGGVGADIVADATVDASGSVYVAGSFTGPATAGTGSLPGAGGFDGYLIKYSALGSQEWVQTSGGSGLDAWRGVKLSATGAPYVTGHFSATAQVAGTTLSSAGGTDVAVAAYSAQGAPLWAQQAGGSDTDYGMALGLVAGGGLYVRGLCRPPGVFGNLTLGVASVSGSSFTAQLGPQPLAGRVATPLVLGAYPNPATDWLALPGLPAGSRAEVLDALGRTVRPAAPVPATGLPVHNLAPGLYVLRATDPQGQRYTGRFAVE